jgi:hypothetical protein
MIKLFETQKEAKQHLENVCIERNLINKGFVIANTGSVKVELPPGAIEGVGIEMVENVKNEKGNNVSRKYTEYAAFKSYSN